MTAVLDMMLCINYAAQVCISHGLRLRQHVRDFVATFETFFEYPNAYSLVRDTY